MLFILKEKKNINIFIKYINNLYIILEIFFFKNKLEIVEFTSSKSGSKEKIAEITDKLTAVFGELKAAVEKKISDKLRELKKKLFNLFGIVEADNEEEEKRVEEEKRLFDLKNLKEILFNPERHRDESQENEQKDGEK